MKPGTRYGSRTVIGPGSKDRHGKQLIRVRCDCGEEQEVTPGVLRRSKRCAACSPHGGQPGRTWRITCKRCGGKGHQARTCEQRQSTPDTGRKMTTT